MVTKRGLFQFKQPAKLCGFPRRVRPSKPLTKSQVDRVGQMRKAIARGEVDTPERFESALRRMREAQGISDPDADTTSIGSVIDDMKKSGQLPFLTEVKSND